MVFRRQKHGTATGFGILAMPLHLLGCAPEDIMASRIGLLAEFWPFFYF